MGALFALGLGACRGDADSDTMPILARGGIDATEPGELHDGTADPASCGPSE